MLYRLLLGKHARQTPHKAKSLKTDAVTASTVFQYQFDVFVRKYLNSSFFYILVHSYSFSLHSCVYSSISLAMCILIAKQFLAIKHRISWKRINRRLRIKARINSGLRHRDYETILPHWFWGRTGYSLAEISSEDLRPIMMKQVLR